MAGVVASSLLGTVLSLVVAMSGPAASATAETGPSVTVPGHGNGHGRGLGQWGAYGYAVDGWNRDQILGHFYGGTYAAGVDPSREVTVRLTRQDGLDLVVTSQVPFFVGGYPIDATRAVRISPTADGGFQMTVAYGCGQPPVPNYAPRLPHTLVWPSVHDPGNNIDQMLTICGWDGRNRSYRGMLHVVIADGAQRTVNTATVEQYLRGVVPRESPASWPQATLQAQAVAARSYALAEGGEFGQRYSYAKTCDTTACQVYNGAGDTGAYIEHPNTDFAIASTAGVVRRFNGSNALARTEFSSSSGGYTAGGQFPAVPDDGDRYSPYHDWQQTIFASSLQAKYPIGTFIGVDITSRNGLGDFGGRVLGMRVVGTAGSVSLSGDQFRIDWGLRSNWFNVSESPYLVWYLRNSNTPGPPEATIYYGGRDDTPVTGDWDANGYDTIGVFTGSWWFLRNDHIEGDPHIRLNYGSPGWLPITGNWDAAGGDSVGVFTNGVWNLRNSLTPGPPDISVYYGAAGYLPVVGDWDGNGTDTIGVFINGVWHLRNSNTPGPPDITVYYGAAGYTPVVGDWNGDGIDTIGVYISGTWHLRNSNTPGPPDVALAYGAPGYLPVAADHDATGTTTVGTVRRAG